MKAWIARDRDGSLYLFKVYPEKLVMQGFWVCNPVNRIGLISEQDLPTGCNPQWSDDEPIEVELTINLKKE